MRSRTHVLFRFLTYVTLFFFLCGQLIACNGGSGGDDDDDTSSGANLAISDTSSYPGQFLKVYHDELDVDGTYAVQLSDNGEYDMTLPADCAATGEILIQVPMYIANDDITSGDVTVSITGLNGNASLHIKDTPTINYETGEQPGDILRWWLNETRLSYQQTLDSLDSFSTDTSDMAQQLQSEIDRLTDAIDEFDTTGSMTLYFSDSESQTLTENNLKFVDEMLFLRAAGLMQVYDDVHAPAAHISRGVLDDILSDPNLNPSQRRVLEDLRRVRDQVIPNTLDQIDSGSDLFTAMVGSLAALGALYVAAKAGTAYALLYSGMAALSYAGITGSLSEGLTWFQSKLDNALGDMSLGDYVFGEEWFEHAVEGAQSFAFNLGGGVSETYGELANTFWTAWSAIKAEYNLYCSTQNSPNTIQSGLTTLQPLEVDAEICEAIDQSPIGAVSLATPNAMTVDQSGSFTISISGSQPPFKIDLDWDDGTTAILFAVQNSATIEHTYEATGSYLVGVSATDIFGSTATTQETVSVDGPAGQTMVSFTDMWDTYTVTLTFPEGQAESYVIIEDTDVYNTDELVEVEMPNYPADANLWPQSIIPVQIQVSGPDIEDWLFYRNNSKSDWSTRVLLTHMTEEVQNLGSAYYFIVVYPTTGPYKTIAFRLIGLGG